jgi:hypothetical protein
LLSHRGASYPCNLSTNRPSRPLLQQCETNWKNAEERRHYEPTERPHQRHGHAAQTRSGQVTSTRRGLVLTSKVAQRVTILFSRRGEAQRATSKRIGGGFYILVNQRTHTHRGLAHPEANTQNTPPQPRGLLRLSAERSMKNRRLCPFRPPTLLSM